MFYESYPTLCVVLRQRVADSKRLNCLILKAGDTIEGEVNARETGAFRKTPHPFAPGANGLVCQGLKNSHLKEKGLKIKLYNSSL